MRTITIGHSVKTLKLDIDLGSVFESGAAAEEVVADEAPGVHDDVAPVEAVVVVLVESDALVADGVVADGVVADGVVAEVETASVDAVVAVVEAGAKVATFVSSVADAVVAAAGAGEAVVEPEAPVAAGAWSCEASDSNACSTVFFMLV